MFYNCWISFVHSLLASTPSYACPFSEILACCSGFRCVQPSINLHPDRSESPPDAIPDMDANSLESAENAGFILMPLHPIRQPPFNRAVHIHQIDREYPRPDA